MKKFPLERASLRFKTSNDLRCRCTELTVFQNVHDNGLCGRTRGVMQASHSQLVGGKQVDAGLVQFSVLNTR